jgi:predicted nucleic acid-binding protein
MLGASVPTAAVVDASVAVKCVVSEPHSEAAAALLDRPTRWVAPRLMLVEAALSTGDRWLAHSRNVGVLGVGAAAG